MSTTADDTDPTQEPTGESAKTPRFQRTSRAAKAAQGVYRHVAAVLGAIGIAALVAHFGVDWRGSLAEIVGLWDSLVRPPIALFFHILISVPLSWFDVGFEVPLWIRDYFAIGVVLALSGFRSRRAIGQALRPTTGSYREMRSQIAYLRATRTMPWYRFDLTFAFWPISLTLLVANIFDSLGMYYWHRKLAAHNDDADAYTGDLPKWLVLQVERLKLVLMLQTVAPLMYFSILLLINQFL